MSEPDRHGQRAPWVLPDCHCHHTGQWFRAILANQEMIMSALTDLQAADAALKAEVATFLADVATALGADDPDIESVVADINAQVAALQSADPATPAPEPEPSPAPEPAPSGD